MEGEEEYEVEELLQDRNHIISRGHSWRTITEYLVKWKGYPVEEATWLKRSNLANAEELVKQYENKEDRIEDHDLRHLENKGGCITTSSPGSSTESSTLFPTSNENHTDPLFCDEQDFYSSDMDEDVFENEHSISPLTTQIDPSFPLEEWGMSAWEQNKDYESDMESTNSLDSGSENQLIAHVPAETWPSHGLPCLTVGLPFSGEPGFVMTSPPLPLVHYLLQQEVLESEDILCAPLIDKEAFPGGSPTPQPCCRHGAQPSAPVTSNFSLLSNGQTLTLVPVLPFSPCPVDPPAGPSTLAPPHTPVPCLPLTPAPPPYQLHMPLSSCPPPASESQPPTQMLRVPASTPRNALPLAATFLDLNCRVTASLPVLSTLPMMCSVTALTSTSESATPGLKTSSAKVAIHFSLFSTPMHPALPMVMSSRTSQCQLHAQVSPPLPLVVGNGEFSAAPVPPALQEINSTPQPQEPLFFPSSEKDDGHHPPSRSPQPPSDFSGTGDLFDDIPVIKEARAPSPELVHDAVSGNLITDHDFDMGSPVVEVSKCTTHSKGKGKAGTSPSRKKKLAQKTKAPPATPPQAAESIRSPPPFLCVHTSALHHTIAYLSPTPVAGPSHLAKCKKQLQAARVPTLPVEDSPPHIPLTCSCAAATKAAVLPPIVELPEESESGSNDDVPPKKKHRISDAKKEKKEQVSPEKGKAKNKPGAGTEVAISRHSTSCSELEALTFEDIREGPAAFFKPVWYSDKNGIFGACLDPFPYFVQASNVSGDCIPCLTRDLNCTWMNQFPEMNKVSSKLAKYVRYHVGSMESDLKELRALNHNLEHLDVLMQRNFLQCNHLICQLVDSLDQIASHENSNAIIEGLASTYEEVASFIISE
ncbi:uncharacterized protein EV420DRAFT_1642965 [Desarmillaria tabescens]|uniref:Chromo domain-containing protein n=1 Tax=Armillaria tabescens TaxID=1929756 RepID=A0AA39N5X7_ARMTA|nr:uncharacterized protein EV420DRAFT_1642965 [Desarmillaria tabescens]KAK0458629.1 hypothetical protein EV420DRAFT_1642965 [Desarmillaria tabescens]